MAPQGNCLRLGLLPFPLSLELLLCSWQIPKGLCLLLCRPLGDECSVFIVSLTTLWTHLFLKVSCVQNLTSAPGFMSSPVLFLAIVLEKKFRK